MDKLAKDVSGKIGYTMLKDILVKPLEPVMVMKSFKVPVTKDTKKDDGLDINEYDDVATETKEVESNFATGIILLLPANLADDFGVNVGDTIVYNKKFSAEFDLFKNSVLVKPYDVLAVVNKPEK